jgi:hypothetical protein
LERPREAFTLVFIDADATRLGDDAIYEPDPEDSLSYKDWIEKIIPGEVVEHELVPLVYEGEEEEGREW